MQSDPTSLDRLQDIVQPQPVAWWPPAPFWYCLIALAAVWLCHGLAVAAYRWIQNAYRRQALRELALVIDHGDRRPAAISTILKRVALVSFPPEEVASLSGDAWLRFLNETCSEVDFLTASPAARSGFPHSIPSHCS